MAASLPPADDNDEFEDDDPLFGAGFTTAFAYGERLINVKS